MAMDNSANPSVLFVYYTYTQQTLKVLEAMGEVLRDRGCEVIPAGSRSPSYGTRIGSCGSRCPIRSVNWWA